ncbi:ricin-type beta-trefoil lectin domain protein [Nonomuraea sp. NPDC050556]|uniref:ricin-type beta-trefoil lectin domain protein n=1 Tax=Nonomuraea sp. NPDC050556 TaxID=3364369 RepID=UPI00379B5EBA
MKVLLGLIVVLVLIAPVEARAAGSAQLSVYGQPGFCLETAAGNAGKATLQKCDTSKPGQMWTYSNQVFKNDAGYCLDVPSNAPANSVQPWGYTCNSSAAQKWTYSTTDYTIKFTTTYCLDVSGGAFVAGTPVIIYGCHGGANQKWVLGFSDMSVTTTYTTTAPLKIKPGASATVTAFSTGNAADRVTAPRATLTLTPQSGLTMTGTTGTGWNCTSTTSCWATNVAAGTTGSVSRTLTVPSTATPGTRYQVSATVAVSEVNDQAGNNDAILYVEVVPFVNDLRTTTAAATLVTDPGVPVTPSFTVTNLGGDPASAVTVTLTWPADFTATALSAATGWTCTLATRTCTGPSLAVDGQAAVSVTGTVAATVNADASLQISATSTVGPLGTDPVSTNNTATVTITMSPVDLRIAKQGPSDAVVGAPFSYTVTVTNAGTSKVVAASVRDTLPATLASVSWSCTATAPNRCATATGTGNAITTSVDLAAGGKATFTVTATATEPASGTNVTNTATVTAPTGVTDPDTANNTSSAVTAMTSRADLEIKKSLT